MIKYELFIVLFVVLLVGCANLPSSVPTQAATPDTKTPTPTPNTTGEPMSAEIAVMTLPPRSAPATPTRFVATATADASMILTAVPTLYAQLTARAATPVLSGSLDNVTFAVPNGWFVSERSSQSIRLEPSVADGTTFIRLELVEDQFEMSQLVGELLLSHDQVIATVEDVHNPSLQVRRLALVDSILILMDGETLASNGNTYRQLYRDVYDSFRLSD